jgi:F-type H+-transporting ATPase subunit b
VLIDWFTVAAQIVNFLILVGLLKYFLYGRIIRAMDQREEKIAARLSEAQEREQEAADERRHFQARQAELAQQQDDILNQARQEADSERRKLLEEAREEVEAVKARWYEALEREKNTFLQDLRQRAGRQVYTITRQALADLATADLELQIVEAFCRRLQEQPPEKRRELTEILQQGAEATIISAFVLPEEAKQKIEDILKDYLKDGAALRYQTSPEVISGIELKAPGHKVAWSLDHYLAELEAETREILEAKMPG